VTLPLNTSWPALRNHRGIALISHHVSGKGGNVGRLVASILNWDTLSVIKFGGSLCNFAQ
jgi:hypothetical protein